MPNKVDNAISKMKNVPWVSASTLAAGVALPATWSIEGAFYLGAGVAMASPFLCAGMMAVGATSLFRERSGLSKAFSVAAIGAGGAGLAGLVTASSAPGFEALMGIMYVYLGMTAAAGFNVAAHYTRNVHVKLDISARQKGNDNTPPAP